MRGGGGGLLVAIFGLPNFIKREKNIARVCTNAMHFST